MLHRASLSPRGFTGDCGRLVSLEQFSIWLRQIENCRLTLMKPRIFGRCDASPIRPILACESLENGVLDYPLRSY